MPVPITATFNRVGDDMAGPKLIERLGSGAASILKRTIRRVGSHAGDPTPPPLRLKHDGRTSRRTRHPLESGGTSPEGSRHVG